ncbi:MAG: hypothetical protein EOO28_12595 [Comamonadaceae bacterium]|nr:MAG: hypothetical protein EOO28_12595 [Comamonadaceae bacterium]
MNYTRPSTRTTHFAKANHKDHGTTFKSSQNVRHWLVLRALDAHRAGEYVSDSKEMEHAFGLVVDGVRSGKIKLAYKPPTLLTFALPGREDPMHLQAMVYWCTQMNCSLEILADAHCSLGSKAPLKDLFEIIARLKREHFANLRWKKTVLKETMTPATVPMPLL